MDEKDLIRTVRFTVDIQLRPFTEEECEECAIPLSEYVTDAPLSDLEIEEFELMFESVLGDDPEEFWTTVFEASNLFMKVVDSKVRKVEDLDG